MIENRFGSAGASYFIFLRYVGSFLHHFFSDFFVHGLDLFLL